MKIQNTRNNHIITENGKFATTFVDRALGLLRHSNPRSILFNTRFGVHTLLLSRPIDIVILDDHFVVKKIKGNLSPFRFYFWNPIYPYVLELPSGTIQKTDLQVGDSLTFDPPVKS